MGWAAVSWGLVRYIDVNLCPLYVQLSCQCHSSVEKSSRTISTTHHTLAGPETGCQYEHVLFYGSRNIWAVEEKQYLKCLGPGTSL